MNFLRRVWHDPVWSKVISMGIVAAIVVVYGWLSKIGSIYGKSIKSTAASLLLGKSEIYNIYYYAILTLALLCVVILLQHFRLKRQIKNNEIKTPMVVERSTIQLNQNEIVPKSSQPSVTSPQSDAGIKLKSHVEKFKYSWNAEVFNFAGDVEYGRKLLKDLEVKLRDQRDALDPLTQSNLMDYLSSIINRIREYLGRNTLILGIGDPVVKMKFWSGGSEIIQMLDRIENFTK